MSLETPFSGNNTTQWITPETVAGELNPNPVWNQIVYSSGLPVLTRDALIDETLNGSREISDVATGSSTVAGEYAGNLTVDTFKSFIESALQTTRIDGLSISGVEITVDNATKTYTRATGDFVADGVAVGDSIYFAGMSGNNSKTAKVTAVNALVVTVGEVTRTLTDETLTVDYKTGGKYEVGSECKTFSILTWFKGRCGTEDKYFITTGAEVSGFTFTLAVNAYTTFSFPFNARKQEVVDTLPVGSTFIDAVNDKKFVGTDGKVVVDGELTPFTSLTIGSDGAASPQFEVNDSNGDASFIEYGTLTNTVSISAFMRDTSLHNKFLTNTQSSISSIQECQKGSMMVSYNSVFLTASTPDLSAATSITQTLEGTATGAVNNSSIIIQEIVY